MKQFFAFYPLVYNTTLDPTYRFAFFPPNLDSIFNIISRHSKII